MQADSVPSQLFGSLADSTQQVGFKALSSIELENAMLVLSPVLGEGFDAVDLAAFLHNKGYNGRYIAFADHFPDYAIIAREVLAVAPDLTFDVIETGRGPHRAPYAYAS